MADNDQSSPTSHQVSVGQLIRYLGIIFTLGSALVTVTAFVVKSSFPSDAAVQALDLAKKNEIKFNTIMDNDKITNANDRLTRLEVEYSNSIENQKQIRNQLDKMTDLMMDIKNSSKN